jgi:hypothetical protein
VASDEPERTGDESIPSVLDVVAPALERSSALAGELARLLARACLFS